MLSCISVVIQFGLAPWDWDNTWSTGFVGLYL